MIKIFLIAADNGPDYLQDLIIHGLIQHSNIDVYFSHFPPYLCKDYDPSLNIYGRGFTAFRRLGNSRRYWEEKVISSREAMDKVDICMYLNVQRLYNNAECLRIKSANIPVIAIDGEDNTDINRLAHESCTIYYKRELLYNGENIRPISFKIPKECIGRLVPGNEKISLLAPCDPRNRNTYIYTREADYYNQYARSFFGVTLKKGGWDCMRHYEIIAAGAVPFFIDISKKPVLTMADYPVELQEEANELAKNALFSPASAGIWLDSYISIQARFNSWLVKRGTTCDYAKLFLQDLMRFA